MARKINRCILIIIQIIDFLNELKKCIEEFNIPHEPFFDLIEGMEIDLNKNRFQTFDELKEYCYKVASTVGLMTIPVFGYKNKTTEEYAINLGIALQLTNIIRDVKTDSLEVEFICRLRI